VVSRTLYSSVASLLFVVMEYDSRKEGEQELSISVTSDGF
jgi:hypothetical protein